jgi:hypothetical protein
LFLLKGILGLVTAFKVFDDIYPIIIGANVWDFLNMLITEIGPTLVFIILSSKKSETTPREDGDDLNENERELTNYDIRVSN